MPRRELGFIFALYMCQGLPGGFLAVVLPVILRQRGLDLATVGLASAVGLPFVLKVLWAPWVDRVGWARIGQRRSWLLPMQLGMLVVTVALSQTDPSTNLGRVVLLFAVLNLFAATQDIAVDGWAVTLFAGREQGVANGAQVAGFKVGNLLGGGVLLALLGVLGWSGSCGVMAGVLGVVWLLVWATPEPVPDAPRPRAVWRRLLEAVRAQGAIFWLFIVAAKFGETLGGAQVKPMLVDYGYVASDIGLLDGVVGGVAVIVGASVVGAAVRARGWVLPLAACSIVQGACLLALSWASLGSLPVFVFAPINACEAAAGGGVAVCIFALAMSRADVGIGGSAFTVAQVLYMSGAFVAAPLGGALVDRYGYAPALGLSGVLAVAFGVLAPWAGRRFGATLGS